MAMDSTVTVTEARDDLRRIIDRAKAGSATWVGSHRRPEAAVVGVRQLQQAPPPDVLRRLLTSQAVAAAHYSLCVDATGPVLSAGALHPGDSYGETLAWLWETQQHEAAALFVADLLAELRQNNPHSGDREPPTLERLLKILPLALPARFAPERELIDYLRDQVGRYLPDVASENRGG